jgi:hypothetical protein
MISQSDENRHCELVATGGPANQKAVSTIPPPDNHR